MTLEEKYKQFLAVAWEKDEDPWQYVKAVGTAFIGFVANAEKAFSVLFDRLKVIEEQQATILKALNLAPEDVQQPASGAQPAAAPQAAPPAPSNGGPKRDIRGMVRLGADDQPMTPEDQAIEEKMDMATLGKIDETRYVSRGSVPSAPPAPPSPPSQS